MVKNKVKSNLKPFKEIWTEIPVKPMIFEMEAAENWAKHMIRKIEKKQKSEIRKKNDFFSILSDFIKKEKLHVLLCKITDTKIWLEAGNGVISIKLIVDNMTQTLLYDIYSSNLNAQLQIETLEDLEKIIYIEEESQDWKIINDLEEIWLILDEIKFWGYHNQFRIKEIELVT